MSEVREKWTVDFSEFLLIFSTVFFNLTRVPCAHPGICLKWWTLHHGLKYPVTVWLSRSRNKSQSWGSPWEELSLVSTGWGRGRRGQVGHAGKFNAVAATAHDRAPTPARVAIKLPSTQPGALWSKGWPSNSFKPDLRSHTKWIQLNLSQEAVWQKGSLSISCWVLINFAGHSSAQCYSNWGTLSPPTPFFGVICYR